MDESENQQTTPRFRPVRYGSGFVLAAVMTFVEPAFILDCSRLENNRYESKALSFCASRLTCESLVDRSFPPHNHTENPDGERPSNTVSFSASEQVTNVSAQVVSSSPLLRYSPPNDPQIFTPPESQWAWRGCRAV